MELSRQSGSQMAQRILSEHRERIMMGLSVNGYFIYQNDELKKLIETAREEYLNILPSLKLNPQLSKLDRKSLDTAPWRKLAIGATNGVGEPYAQFLATTYLGEQDPNFPALGMMFEILISLRNMLGDLPQNFKPDNFWNACRIHHYPKGGAFMSRHRDTHFPKLLASSEIPFLQVSACMSQKGNDFLSGGGFVVSKQGEKIDLESFGSLVFFDGSVEHGVDCVDLDVIPDLFATSGRLAAFANLYEVLG